MPPRKGASLVKRKAGILLDASLGGTPQPNALTFADLKASPLELPWPLPARSVHTCICAHLLEFLPPTAWFDFWNEVHRVMRVGGIVYCSGPWGGDESQGWLSDPTHQTRVVEQSFAWLDPRLPYFNLHPTVGRALPKPWHVLASHRVPGENATISYNITLASVAPTNGNGKR